MERYLIRTFGCQMNKHDSERIAGLLESEGLVPVDEPDDADVVVFNTCCVREKAEERFRGQVAALAGLKKQRPELLVAVCGCAAQKDGERLLERLPQVDVVFGTHNIGDIVGLLAEARARRSAVVRIQDAAESFSSVFPTRRDTAWHAWLPIMVGCDNHCTYCIVPTVRGRERSRPLEAIVEEARTLAADGVVEITLLGQNVNSYGRDLYGSPRFAEVLSAVAASGVARVRFTTSHPKDLTQETIEAMARTPQVCRHLHLPLQSGSTRILERMNRTYTKEHYLELVDRLYATMPDLALSTDIMVGFPGEADEDFKDTLDVVERAGFDQAFTFVFSPRDGTPAASMPQQVPRDIARERFDQLVGRVNANAEANNRKYFGTEQRILVEGPSKRNDAMLLGRTETNKVVHAPYPSATSPNALVGILVDVEITAIHTWFLEGRIRASQA